MARKSLHKSVVKAVLLLNNLTLLILNGTKLRKEALESSIHINFALVSCVLELVATDV
jgi:hypothetical protein